MVNREPIASATRNSRGRDITGSLGGGTPFSGMSTVEDVGIGEQVVENLRISSSRYTKMFGDSLFKDLGNGAQILNIFEFKKSDGSFQICVTFAEGAFFRFRAIESDGTVITPTVDVDFTSDTFDFVQLGAFGYLSNNSATTQLYSWDGAALTAIANAPANIEFLSLIGRRLVAGANDLFDFSARLVLSPVLTDWNAVGLDGNSVYNAGNVGKPTAAVAAQGQTVAFWIDGSEMHGIFPNNAGDNLSGETKVPGYNSQKGAVNKKRVVSTPNNIYVVDSEGLWEINPFSGVSINLVANAGKLEKYWETFDFTDSQIIYSPKEEMVLISIREQGEGTNSKLVCYDLDNKAFYIKTRVFAFSLGVIDNQVYAGDYVGRLFKVFDETTFSDNSGMDIKCRLITEWSGITSPVFFKSFVKAGFFGNVSPDSSLVFNLFEEGDVRTSVVSRTFNAADISDTSSVIELMGKYEMSIAKADELSNSKVIRRTRFINRFITYCVEITEESSENFKINSIYLGYSTRNKDVFQSLLSDELFTLSV